MLIKYEAHSPLGCSKLNKHGFHPDDTPAPRGLGWQVLKTMRIRHETIFIPPGNTTSKPQTPSRCPGSSPFYTKTKLRENATNNPEQRCICSKHGFHPERVPAPGGLGWQILKTMLIRYEAPVISPNSANVELDFTLPPANSWEFELSPIEVQA